MQQRFSKKSIFIYLIALLVYLLWVSLSMGIRSDHLTLIAVLSLLYFFTEHSHRFLIGLFPIIFSWFVLDTLRAIPSYHFNEVHIKDLYETELHLFGIFDEGKLITPNQFLEQFDHNLLHLITGFTYLFWIPIPCLLCLILYLKNKPVLLTFSTCFLITNFIGIVVYYLYPAAPPWYVDVYGFEFYPQTPGSAARLSNFDNLTGIPVFEGIYAKSFNVFGAVPSLHSAYPVVSFFYARKAKMFWLSYALFAYVGLTWFTAVFTNHHYIIDVLLGIACAILAIVWVEWLVSKKMFKALLSRYEAY